jgi:hypothetical protein
MADVPGLLPDVQRLPAHHTPAPLLLPKVIDPAPSCKGVARLPGRPFLRVQFHAGPQAWAPNRLHEVDLVGPIYPQGSGRRCHIWVGKYAFDGAVCLRLACSRRMDEVPGFPPGLAFLPGQGVFLEGSVSRAGPGGAEGVRGVRGMEAADPAGLRRGALQPALGAGGWAADRVRAPAHLEPGKDQLR